MLWGSCKSWEESQAQETETDIETGNADNGRGQRGRWGPEGTGVCVCVGGDVRWPAGAGERRWASRGRLDGSRSREREESTRPRGTEARAQSHTHRLDVASNTDWYGKKRKERKVNKEDDTRVFSLAFLIQQKHWRLKRLKIVHETHNRTGMQAEIIIQIYSANISFGYRRRKK